MNILNKLTIKHLTMNKKRTIVSIIGIILSTALMVGIGLLLSTFRDLMIDDIIQYKGNYHASFSEVDKNKISVVENNSNVDEVFYKQYMGDSLITDTNYNNSYKPYFELYGASDSYFASLKLLEGRLPKNSNEIVISKHIETTGGITLKVGDTLTLNLGERYLDGKKIEKSEYTEGEYLANTISKEYTIVGVVSRDVLEDYSYPAFSIFTKLDSSCNNSLTVYARYNKPAKTYKISESIASSLGFKSTDDKGENYDEISYNDSLVSMYGASKYNNMMDGMMGMLAIMLGLVSVACIIVIYNSFAISVLERKKQFGLFSSIGATKKQIRKTVLFEAIIVSLIGIPLGVLGAYLGIGVVVLIMSNLIGDMLNGISIHLSTYPLFVIIPILFMIITVLISAFIPAKKASKISPIEAIRLNDDIKIKGKKVKSPKWIEKIFGIEGLIAYKNMKRNKKKYRITVASLFISIVLFISFSGYLSYSLAGATSYLNVPEFDIDVQYSDNIDSNIIKTIKNNEDVKESVTYKMATFYTTTDFSKMYLKDYSEFLTKNKLEAGNNIIVLVLDNDSYTNYLNSIGKNEAKPILYNKYSGIVYGKNSRKGYTYNMFDNAKTVDINISNVVSDTTDELNQENDKDTYKTIDTISDYYVSDENLLSIEVLSASPTPILIVNNKQAENYGLEDYNNDLIIKAPNYSSLDKVINNYIDNNKVGQTDHFNYENITEQMKLMKNIVLVMKILIYGFITLVTLIGVTSVFNTINTSIALRRKEFAVLRSIGLTPKGFNKTLCFESLFFGLKSLLYGLPVSFAILYLMYLSMNNMVELGHMLVPWTSVLIAVLGVFAVIGLSTIYATKRIKKENILDAIREENI